MPVNRIVTKGFGTSRGTPGRAGPVTLGYGGPPSFVVAALERNVRLGGGGVAKRRLRELQPIVVWAKLIEFNGHAPKRNIEGFVTVRIDKDRSFASVMAEHVFTRAKKLQDSVKVFVDIVRGRRKI